MSEKQTEYLRLLQERNRLKKQMNAKSKEQLAKEELERGFNTHFRTSPRATVNSGIPIAVASNGSIPVIAATTQNPRAVSPTRDSKSSRAGKGGRTWGNMKGIESKMNENLAEVDSNKMQHFHANEGGSSHNKSGSVAALDEYESDFDDLESEIPISLKPKKSAKEDEHLDDFDIDQSLVRRITQLGSQQKQKLLSLLAKEIEHQTVVNDSPTNIDSINSVMHNTSTEEAKVKDNEEMDLAAHAAFSSPAWQGPKVSIVKLRLLTCYDNAKMVSLRAVRLRLLLPSSAAVKDSNFFDLLPLCQLRVFSGLLPVAGTSEACRLLPNLTGCNSDLDASAGAGSDGIQLRRGRAVSSDLLRRLSGKGSWKASLSSACPLEIRIELPSPDILWENLQKMGLVSADDDISPGQLLFGGMQLLVWNAMVGCGGVKDADVYVDNCCIFSGELPTAAAADHEAVSSSELFPAVSIPLLAKLSAAVPVTTGEQQEISTRAIVPEVLSTQQEQNDTIADSVPISHPKLFPVHNAESSLQPKGTIPSKSNEMEYEKKDKMRPRRGRRGERSGLQSVNEGDEMEEGLVQPAGERERIIRQSLEAIQRAEKNNLGRLRKGTDLVAGPDSLSAVTKDWSTVTKSGLESQPANVTRSIVKEDEVLDDSLEQTVNSMDPAIGENSVFSEVEQELEAGREKGYVFEPVPKVAMDRQHQLLQLQQQQQQHRSNRIEKVQETIQNTLADLNDIMSSLAISKPKLDRRDKDKDKDKEIAIVKDESAKPNNFICPPTGDSFPRGRILRLEILSTWGDRNYVGLNGLELFDHSGRLCTWASSRARADKSVVKGVDEEDEEEDARFPCISDVMSYPSDINSLAQFKDSTKDPRSALNLMDGHNFTRSDMHAWLAPNRLTFETAKEKERQVDRNDSDSEFEDAAVSKKNDQQTALTLLEHKGWLPSQDVLAVVVICFAVEIQLSMARIFNYNKSRTHNQRGVRHCRLLIDDLVIFEGELRRASGQLLSLESESDILELCKNKPILHRARTLSNRINSKKQIEDDVLEESVVSIALAMQRPKTSHVEEKPPPSLNGISFDNESMSTSLLIPPKIPLASKESVAPILDADSMRRKREEQDLPNLAASGSFDIIFQQAMGLDISSSDGSSKLPSTQSASVSMQQTRQVRLDLLSTWGDSSFVGLCGLELLGRDLRTGNWQPLSVDVEAHPRDLSSIGCFSDPRVLSNLVNGRNDTIDERHMWLIPFTSGGLHYVQLTVKGQEQIAAIRIWNYNKAGSEDLMRGCKEALLSLDGRPLKKFLLRMGVGCPGVQYPQTLLINESTESGSTEWLRSGGPGLRSYISPSVRQDYETPTSLGGLLWKFTFLDNWDDGYYLGLDRIDFVGPTGESIDVLQAGAIVDAIPHSLRDIIREGETSTSLDPRTPEKLFADPSKLSQSDSRPQQPGNFLSWLCPLSRCMTKEEKLRLLRRGANDDGENDDGDYQLPANNTLFVLFNNPVHVAALRFYNYSKTPARGVRDFSVTVDGSVVYMGSLLPADKEKQHSVTTNRLGAKSNPLQSSRSRGQAVLFTNDPKIVAANKDLVSYCGSTEQDVLCINERQVMVRSKSMYSQLPPNANLEGVQCDFSKRPLTGFVSS